jgi:kynureninase
MQEFAERATRGVRAWAEGWWDMPVTVGERIGEIIGAPRGSVTMHQNVATPSRSSFRALNKPVATRSSIRR